jgi:hypothetical protein
LKEKKAYVFLLKKFFSQYTGSRTHMKAMRGTLKTNFWSKYLYKDPNPKKMVDPNPKKIIFDSQHCVKDSLTKKLAR